MDNGGYSIKEICRQCLHWGKAGNGLKENFKVCGILNKEEKMYGWSGEGIDLFYETAPDFGCCFFEPDYSKPLEST